MDKTMKLTKADAYRYADDLLECTRRLYDFLDGEAELWIEYSCFKDIEKKAMMIFDWIVNTDDEETASTLAKLDRNLWHRILKFCDIFCHKGIKLYNSMTTVYNELLRVQNWYLKTVYKLPYEAIENNEYYIHPETGEVRNSKTQEVLQAPKYITLPDELCTDKAQKAFAKAIEKRWIKKSTTGLIWLGTKDKKNKAELAYLCARIYGYIYSPNNGNVGNNVPYEALNSLFGETRLDRAMQQVFEAKKPQRWRKTIDKILQD